MPEAPATPTGLTVRIFCDGMNIVAGEERMTRMHMRLEFSDGVTFRFDLNVPVKHPETSFDAIFGLAQQNTMKWLALAGQATIADD